MESVLGSLRTRIVLSVVLIELVMLTLLVWNNLHLLYDSHTERLQDTARSLVQLFARTAAPQLVAVDYVTLEHYAASAQMQDEVLRVRVLDRFGATVAQVGNDRALAEPQGSEHFVLRQAVEFAGKRRGEVEMTFSTARLQEAVAAARRQGLIIAGSEILLSLAAALLVGIALTRRLEGLVKSTAAVAAGEYGRMLPPGGPQEVRSLTGSFNAMQVAIRSRMDALRASEARFRTLVDHSPDGVVLLSPAGSIRDASRAAVALFGTGSVEQTLSRPVTELVTEDSRQDVERAFAEACRGSPAKSALRVLAGGQERWLEAVIAPIVDTGSGEIESLIANVRDVTVARQQAAALEHLSLHDSLTGLPNRSLLLRTLAQAMERRGQRPISVALIDLDRFKEVNDTLGHHAGDDVLRCVAARLHAVSSDEEMVARLGGDEFAVLMPGAGTEAATARCQTFQRCLEQAVILAGMEIRVGGSLGIATCPDHGGDVGMLMKRADVAMYEAKRRGSGVKVYDPEFDPHSVRRLSLLNDLRHAFENGQLVLYYQPKVTADTRALVGVEALVRWRHPRHGLMCPDDFLPLVEQNGLGERLARWVLEAALSQSKRWRDAGLKLPVAVNMSAPVLTNESLPAVIEELLRRMALPVAALGIEITENALMTEPHHSLTVLETLSAMGVRLGIDDFGTGYSSLAYLEKLPVSEVKIDRSFIRRLDEQAGDGVVVDATISLAHALGLSVVAEGVETASAAQRLVGLGCDLLQGFHISPPVEAAQLQNWLCRHGGGRCVRHRTG